MESEKAYDQKKIQARTKVITHQPDKQSKLESEKTPINFKNMRIAISFATENIPLCKSPNLFMILEKCGVSLSNSYRDKHAAHDLLECLVFPNRGQSPGNFEKEILYRDSN